MKHITHNHGGYTGDVISKCHTYAKFNYAGGRVRAWGDRYDDLTDEDNSVLQVKNATKRITDTNSATPPASAAPGGGDPTALSDRRPCP